MDLRMSWCSHRIHVEVDGWVRRLLALNPPIEIAAAKVRPNIPHFSCGVAAATAGFGCAHREAGVWRGCALQGLACLFALIGVLPTTAPAIVLDWNSVNWSAGALTESYDIDSSNPGDDITITITGNTSFFLSNMPNDTTTATGGQGAGQQSLEMRVNWSSDTQTITVAIDFHYAQGVDGVNFLLFDVDRLVSGGSGWRDLVTSIYGQYNGGTPIAPAITDSVANSVLGSGTNQSIRGDASSSGSSSAGNALIDFGTNIVDFLTFTYGNDPTAPNNPSEQFISLYDIEFTPRPIPEFHPGLAVVISCGFLTLWRLAQSRKAAIVAAAVEL